MSSLVDDEEDDYQIRVEDEEGKNEVRVKLTRTGLTIHKLIVRSDRLRAPNDCRDVVCGPERADGFKLEGRKFMNQIVGRYTNRLPAGRQLAHDLDHRAENQIEIKLEENESFDQELQFHPGSSSANCLHGGPDGYDLRDFERVSDDSPIVQRFQSISQHGLISRSPPSSSPQPDGAYGSNSSRLAYYHLHSPDGDQGFPEAIDILATISLQISPTNSPAESTGVDPSDHRELVRIARLGFSLRAKISEPDDGHHHLDRPVNKTPPGRGTPINLTWHTGYLLNDYRADPVDSDGIRFHKLWIQTDHFLDVDRCQLPTGLIKPNRALGIRFSRDTIDKIPTRDTDLKPIQDTMPESGFDHCFLFSGPSDDYDTPKVILQSPKDDVRLVFYSNQSAVQCYSANYFDGKGSRKQLHSNPTNSQGGYQKQEAIYLEFQEPSGVCTNVELQQNLKAHGNMLKYNHDSGRGISNTILYPHKVYSNWFMIDIFV